MKRNILFFALFLLVSISVFSQTKSPKKGIAYGKQTEADMATISQGISWWYNWSGRPDAALANVFQNYNMDFVPMAWNGAFDEAGLRTYYRNHPESKFLLGFNEPNFTTQANMTPSAVAAQWPKLEKIAADYGLKLVGPAVNYCDQCVTEGGVTYSDPIKYLDAFFAACPNCKVDYIAVHNYMCYSGPLKDYIEKFKKYNRPIWLTEFACWDQSTITLEMQKGLVLGALDYLESEPLVFRYSWFTGDRSGGSPYINLFENESGKLSELGELYMNFNPVHDPNVYQTVPSRIEAESYSKMSGISIQATTDVDGVANVGWIDTSDWLDYNIDVPAAGDYYVYLRVASNSNTSLELREGDASLASLSVPASGGWQSWKTLQTSVSLSAGKHSLRVYSPAGGFNLNWIYVSDHVKTKPVAEAGTDVTITLPTNTVTLNGSCTGAATDEVSYLWTKASGSGSAVISSAGSSSTTVTGLLAGTYTFNLKVSNGIESTSDQVTVKVLETTGLNDADGNVFRLYPNPVKDLLSVDFDDNNLETTISIVDQVGKIVWSGIMPAGTNHLEVDFSRFEPGTYVVRTRNPKKMCNRFIVK